MRKFYKTPCPPQPCAKAETFFRYHSCFPESIQSVFYFFISKIILSIFNLIVIKLLEFDVFQCYSITVDRENFFFFAVMQSFWLFFRGE